MNHKRTNWLLLIRWLGSLFGLSSHSSKLPLIWAKLRYLRSFSLSFFCILSKKGLNTMGTRTNTWAIRGADKFGYLHRTVKHGQDEYVRDEVHTNTIEGGWSQMKRSIDGTYHSVSPKYLQHYVNEFVYRSNTRIAPAHLFDLMLAKVVSHAWWDAGIGL